jgi:hypothetical protein
LSRRQKTIWTIEDEAYSAVVASRRTLYDRLFPPLWSIDRLIPNGVYVKIARECMSPHKYSQTRSAVFRGASRFFGLRGES